MQEVRTADHEMTVNEHSHGLERCRLCSKVIPTSDFANHVCEPRKCATCSFLFPFLGVEAHIYEQPYCRMCHPFLPSPEYEGPFNYDLGVLSRFDEPSNSKLTRDCNSISTLIDILAKFQQKKIKQPQHKRLEWSMCRRNQRYQYSDRDIRPKRRKHADQETQEEGSGRFVLPQPIIPLLADATITIYMRERRRLISPI